MPTTILMVCFIIFYNLLKPLRLDQFNCYITSGNVLNLEALKLTSCYRKRNETSYALFLGCLTKMSRFEWASVSSISRKNVEGTGHNSFTFPNRGIVANVKEKKRKVSICNQKFELVIRQLTILLPQTSFSIVPRLRTEDRRRQVRLQSVARNFPLCHFVETGPRAHPASYLMGHYVFAKRLRRTERAADNLSTSNVLNFMFCLPCILAWLWVNDQLVAQLRYIIRLLL